MMIRRSRPAAARLTATLSIATALCGAALAQQTVPFANGIPVAPELPVMPIPDHPLTYRTAEGQDIRVVVVARGIEHPWSIAFLPDDVMLVTQTHGGVRAIRKGVLDPAPIAGVPEVKPLRRSGMLDIALHPKFAENRLVYLTYHKAMPEDKGALALARGRWDGKGLVGTKDLFVTGPDTGSISRIAFGRDGMIYMTTPGGGDSKPQDSLSLAGKVLRLRDDGTVPDDNPFAGKPAYRPEIYTLGHRGTIGLAVHPQTGDLWESENGPNGGDEINILTPGGNYGWPVVSLGRTYQGPWHSQKFQQEGFDRSGGVLDARDRGLGDDVLYGRRTAEVEGRRIRRIVAHGRDHRHRPPRANPLQREDGGAAARVAARGLGPSSARRASKGPTG